MFSHIQSFVIVLKVFGFSIFFIVNKFWRISTISDWFGSSDPFLRFNRTNEGGTYTVVHQTEHINNNCNPMWKKFTIPVRTLCNGDLDRNLKVECFDHNMNGNHALIGEFFITVRQLLEGAGPANEHPCINPKKKVSY